MKKAVKVIIVILLWISTTYSVLSQSLNPTIWNLTGDDSPFSLIHINNYLYMPVYTKNVDNTAYTTLYQLTLSGDTIQSLTLDYNAELSSFITVIPSDEYGFLLIGHVGYLNDTTWLKILKVSHDLNLIWKKSVACLYNNASFVKSEYYNNCIIYVVSGGPGFNLDSYWYKFDYEGNVIASCQQGNPQQMEWSFSLTSVPNTDKLYLTSTGYEYILNSDTKIITLDTNLSLLSVDSIPGRLFAYHNIEFINDTMFYLTGKETFLGPPRNDDMAVFIMDTTFKVYKKAYFGAPDTVDYPGLYKNISLRENGFYLGYTKNMDPNSAYSQKKSWLSVAMVNDSLEQIWQKFYGGDSFYNLCSLLAMPDGGCLIAGTRYDWQLPENGRDIVLMKLDSLGIITSSGQQPEITAHDAIVYPNPGSDFLNIEFGPQIRDAQFFLYDISGKKCFQTQLRNSQEKVQTTTLPSGVYLWHIQHSGKIVESGKWIKE